MKALQVLRETASEAARLALNELPKPALIPNHVLVRVHASAIHPSDVGNASGTFPYTQYPRVVGRDYAGVVEEGPRELVGKEVYGTSGHAYAFTKDGFQAEYTLIQEDEVALKPKNLTFAEAATVGVPFTTASQMIERAAVTESDTVLVIGANGAVGSAASQLAQNIGARVIRATRDESGEVNTDKDPELHALDALTDGKGVDVVLDTVGSPTLTVNGLKKLAKGGRLAFISAPKSGAGDLTIDMRYFYRADLSLFGCNSLNPSAKEMARRLNAITGLFESGKLKPDGKWTPVPLDQALDAYGKLMKKATREKRW
ncbi:GroES-like protein [Trichoderma citrinoviride]|uniref:GroES-like protein n=1 Tax=Trichoderma citrinoviride TaxID=58853 RepID=A0A2T4BLW4_9HYPO|nr:GroES-like protein [Trichoderma citrinoviride]PTB70303.1 GroES-like protein [Trichoderma citrinoviride]